MIPPREWPGEIKSAAVAVALAMVLLGVAMVVKVCGAGIDSTCIVRDNTRSHLSGWIVCATETDAICVTNFHMLADGATQFSVQPYGRRPHRAELIWHSNQGGPHLDVAVLRVRTSEQWASTPIAMDYAVQGDHVEYTGYPRGSQSPVTRRCIVRGYWQPWPKANVMLLDQCSIEGESGSPVFKDGAVVGQVWGHDGRSATCNWQGALKVTLTQMCGPRVCRPRIVPLRPQRRIPVMPSMPAVPQPAPQPVQPQVPTLSDPQPAPDAVTKHDLIALEKRVLAVIEKIEQGPPGPRGPAGPQGPPGEDGQNPSTEDIISQLPPIHVQHYDSDGNFVEEYFYPYPGPIRLRHGLTSPTGK